MGTKKPRTSFIAALAMTGLLCWATGLEAATYSEIVNDPNHRVVVRSEPGKPDQLLDVRTLNATADERLIGLMFAEGGAEVVSATVLVRLDTEAVIVDGTVSGTEFGWSRTPGFPTDHLTFRIGELSLDLSVDSSTGLSGSQTAEGASYLQAARLHQGAAALEQIRAFLEELPDPSVGDAYAGALMPTIGEVGTLGFIGDLNDCYEDACEFCNSCWCSGGSLPDGTSCTIAGCRACPDASFGDNLIGFVCWMIESQACLAKSIGKIPLSLDVSLATNPIDG